MDTPRVFALVLYLSLLGLALFFAVAWAQKWLVFWNKADRPGGGLNMNASDKALSDTKNLSKQALERIRRDMAFARR